MAKAAVAAGCDGLMIEVHNNPEKALCDGPQSLKPAKFEQLMKDELIDLSEFEDILNKDNLYLIINLMLNLQWSNCSDFKELNKIENMVVLKG